MPQVPNINDINRAKRAALDRVAGGLRVGCTYSQSGLYIQPV